MSELMMQPKVQTRSGGRNDLALSIILVCWNNKAYLDPCLKSLYETGMNNSFEVIVVDNGSTDGSQQMLAEKYQEVKIIQNIENVGLGKASNQGIEATSGRYVLLLNNDTIVNGQSFDAMVNFLDKNPKAGAVGGKIFNPDGTVQSCYNYFSTFQEEFLIATRLGELIRPGYPAVMSGEKIKSVDWISSACLMVSRSALDEVGLLDEGYFIYGDEADLQYRLKKAGWDIYYLPQATIIHYGGQSMDRWKRRKMVYRGKMLFYKKNYGSLQEILLRLMLAFLSLAKLVVWGIAFIFPFKRDQANKELQSNLDVLRLCVTLT
jgi:GT2 family glycosyltransferase